jgi:hypothetical protein
VLGSKTSANDSRNLLTDMSILSNVNDSLRVVLRVGSRP